MAFALLSFYSKGAVDRMKMSLFRIVTFAACLLGSSVDHAAAGSTLIPTLYSTGVDDTGAALGTDALDPHYALTVSSDPSAPGPGAYVVCAGFPFPEWAPNLTDPVAQWIAPSPNNSEPNGPYTYQTTFSLTGFIPSTAIITGNLSSDDTILNVLLNGNSLGISTPVQGYGSVYPFMIDQYFQPGINTLTFESANVDGVTTGIIVQMTGTAQAVVPEPCSAALLGIGSAGLLVLHRFRKRSRTA